MNLTLQHRSPTRYALLVSAVFLLLANISFQGIESITTGRLAIIGMGLWALVEGLHPLRYLASRIWLPFLPLAYVAAQFVLVGDSNQLSRFINLAIYSYVGAALFVSLARETKVVLWVLLWACAIQSMFILYSFISLDYRAWFDTAIVTNSNYDAFYLYRAPGFTSGGGASLSVTQSLGVLAAWLLLRPGQPETVNGRLTYVVAGAGLLTAASCIVVGRTGLLLSGLFIALQLIESNARWRLIALLVALVAGLWWSAGALLSNALGDEFSLEYFFTWAFASFAGEDSSVSDIASMPIPPLSLETVVGTGLGSLIDGANPSGHDSGFIQTYYSMGLFFAVIFFLAYLYLLFYCFRWLPLRWRVLLTLVFFLLESKEPFVFKYSVAFVMLSLHFVHQSGRPKGQALIAPAVLRA